MPLHVVDVSRHQVERPDPLDLARAKAAGMTTVNIQLDRGRQEDVLPPWARTYADRARALGMGVSTYKWVDARQSAAEHARRSLSRMRELGGPDGMANVGDCEEDADERTLRDYISAMQDGLQRHVALYSGKWWLDPRGWQLAGLTPYLWAAPSAGYLGGYPGDDSPHWTVNYGGYTTLAAMQYAVTPLPFTGPCSLSAIRDPAVWAALTGKAVMTYADPALLDARRYLMGRGIPGNSLGVVGDTSHQATGGYHVGNDVLARIGKLNTDYSKRQSARDRPGSNAAMALDIGGLSGQQLYALTAWLIAECRRGAPDTADIREVIGRRSPSGGVVRWDRLNPNTTTGTPDHETHTHLSYFRDSEGRDKTSLFRRYYRYYEPAPIPAPQQEDDVMNSLCYALKKATGSTAKQVWALAGQAAAPGGWVETDDEATAIGWAERFGGPNKNSVPVPEDSWESVRNQHLGVS